MQSSLLQRGSCLLSHPCHVLLDSHNARAESSNRNRSVLYEPREAIALFAKIAGHSCRARKAHNLTCHAINTLRQGKHTGADLAKLLSHRTVTSVILGKTV